MHATLEFLQESVRSSSVPSRDPFSILQLGKALFTLFWGAFTFGLGAFHTVMSLILVSSSVDLGAPIGPGEQWLVARGVTLALIASAYGLLVLLLTALAWLGLRRWHRKEAPAAA